MKISEIMKSKESGVKIARERKNHQQSAKWRGMKAMEYER
jgi:hypothetical protein